MSACNVSIPFTGSAQAFVQNLKTKVTAQNGSFSGDEYSGEISVATFGMTLSGTYTINRQQADIVIDNKPMFIGCKQIESYLLANL